MLPRQTGYYHSDAQKTLEDIDMHDGASVDVGILQVHLWVRFIHHSAGRKTW